MDISAVGCCRQNSAFWDRPPPPPHELGQVSLVAADNSIDGKDLSRHCSTATHAWEVINPIEVGEGGGAKA